MMADTPGYWTSKSLQNKRYPKFNRLIDLLSLSALFLLPGSLHRKPASCSPLAFSLFLALAAKVYIVSFPTHNDDRPSKFIVMAANRKQAINMAWEHGEADLQSRSTKVHGTGPGNERRFCEPLAPKDSQ